MRAGGSSAKGASFERSVCRDLSLWITGNERDDIFWRTAMSGGRATIGLRTGKKRDAQAGDAQAIDSLGEAFMRTFSVECKHVKTLQLGQMVAKKSGKTVDFWRKHRLECRSFDREPFMVARENRYPTLLLLTEAGLDSLGVEYVTLRSMFKGRVTVPMPQFAFTDEICILDWERFLQETLPPKHLLRGRNR